MPAPLLALVGVFLSAPLEFGLEVQRGNSSRGTSGFEDAALAESRERNLALGLSPSGTDIKSGVSENVVLATASWDHPLGERWVATAVVGAGWSRATGEAEINSGSSGTTGYRWTIDAPLLELGAGLRRTFGEHWAAGTELSLSHGFLGSGALEDLSSGESLDKGEVGESGTFLEDLDLAWRLRLKIGPQARYGRFAAFPWVGVGSTPTMTSDSKIAGFDCDEDPEWIKLGFGLRLAWIL